MVLETREQSDDNMEEEEQKVERFTTSLTSEHEHQESSKSRGDTAGGFTAH